MKAHTVSETSTIVSPVHAADQAHEAVKMASTTTPVIVIVASQDDTVKLTSTNVNLRHASIAELVYNAPTSVSSTVVHFIEITSALGMMFPKTFTVLAMMAKPI